MRQRKPHPVARGYGWLTERLYNELAWAYDPVSWIGSLGQAAAVRKWALDYLAGSRVLEVGFGTGELLLEMARRDLQVVGLDCSPAMHHQAGLKLRRHGLRVPLVRGVAQQMPFAVNAFDSIVATFPAGYIFDRATWLEAARLLKVPSPLTGGCPGRFIVVGLCASSAGRRLPSVSRFLFGLPLEEMLAHFELSAPEIGLDLQVQMRRHAGLEIPIMVAEKRD